MATKKKTAPKSEPVIVRTYSAGVFYARRVVSRSKDEVVLEHARRMWRWFGAMTLSEVAQTGIDVSKSKIATPTDNHLVLGVIEIIPCSAAAAATIEAATWAQ